jgi:hypothetical protein
LCIERDPRFEEVESKQDEKYLEWAVKDKNKAYWKSLSATQSSTSATFQDGMDCQEQHAENYKTENEIRLKMASRDTSLLLSLKNLLKDLNYYLRTLRGIFKHALEEFLKDSLFKVCHNPFYGGTNFGKHCFRLVTKYLSMFLHLQETSERKNQCESEIGESCSHYELIFGFFS